MIRQHTHEWIFGVSPHTGLPKRQTRNIVKVNDEPIYDWHSPQHDWNSPDNPPIRAVFRNGRKLYEIGQSVAIQPGRGKKAVGRIEIMRIRREDVRDISHEDAIAEGFPSQLTFLHTWASMHDKRLVAPGKMFPPAIVDDRPADRYQAWALEFRLVEGGS